MLGRESRTAAKEFVVREDFVLGTILTNTRFLRSTVDSLVQKINEAGMISKTRVKKAHMGAKKKGARILAEICRKTIGTIY